MGTFTLVWIAAVALGQGAEAPDQSLTVEEYVHRGVPSPNRFWFGRDYKTACAALQKITIDNPSALPRKESPRSKAIFLRLVDTTNLEMLSANVIPLNVRVAESRSLLQELGPTQSLYYRANSGGRHEYAVESLDLMAYTLRVYAKTFDLTDQAYETLPEAERQDPTHKEARERMVTALPKIIGQGLLPRLRQSKLYGQDNLDAFALRLPEIIAPLWPHVKESDREMLIEQIQQESEDNPSAKVRAVLVKLEASLKKLQPADEKDPKP